ncbi:MAG: hypothetical protein IPL51_09015 [Candidatus Competibacteraceae bacterium]|nr:hypothetical protein [Candidatus Competibacteraceae bacterium]
MFNIFGKTDDLPSRHTGPAPSGRIENDGRCTSASPDLIALALEGFDLKGQIEALETRLKTVSDRLANSLGPGAVLVVDGVCRVPIASRQTFKLTDPETCKALLGGASMTWWTPAPTTPSPKIQGRRARSRPPAQRKACARASPSRRPVI